MLQSNKFEVAEKISKYILGIGGLAVAGIGVYIGLSNKEPSKYSLEWIKKLTDKEWETEREIIRQKFCNPEYDESTRIGFQNLLRLFDKVKAIGIGQELNHKAPRIIERF